MFINRQCVEVEEHYNMSHKNRGMALIFNQIEFDQKTGLSMHPREGTNIDKEELKRTLENLGFSVKPYNNLEFHEIKKCLKETALMDHSDSDCLCISVLTHGKHNRLYAKDRDYKPNELWSYFTSDKCPSLAGKPKLFFIQSCAGGRLDRAITLRHLEYDGFMETPDWNFIKHSDFLFVNASAPGFKSIRNTVHGTWFIQTLCEELQDLGTRVDILTLVTFVLQSVAVNYIHNGLIKQIPCLTSTLTRLLVFNSK